MVAFDATPSESDAVTPLTSASGMASSGSSTTTLVPTAVDTCRCAAALSLPPRPSATFKNRSKPFDGATRTLTVVASLDGNTSALPAVHDTVSASPSGSKLDVDDAVTMSPAEAL